MKAYASLSLISVVFGSMIPTLGFASSIPAFFPEISPYPDVEHHRYRDAISWAQALGIVEGYSDGTFRPDATVNRVEFLKILLEFIPDSYLGVSSNCSLPATPPDIQIDSWYFGYACTAILANVMRGYPDGYFRPEQTINFAEAAAIIDRTVLVREHCLDEYGFGFDSTKCKEQGQYWYSASVDRMSQFNILPKSIQGPTHLVTRGEIIDMMYRLRNLN